MSRLQKEILKVVDSALIEDGALFDKTTDLINQKSKIVGFNVIAKEDIIFCGEDIISVIFKLMQKKAKFKNSKIDFKVNFKDGQLVKSRQVIASGSAEASLILACERVLLNLVQHLSGISTITNQFVKTLNNHKIKILDTRKTIPNLRYLQKYGVTKGGGNNHRFNLSDMIMIKDNHIALAGDIGKAINSCKKNSKLKIEVECENVQQVKDAVIHHPDVIMLDNMNINEIKLCTKIIRNFSPKIKIEVSGGINLKNIKDYSNLDIDFISIGYLTHSVIASDISLEIL